MSGPSGHTGQLVHLPGPWSMELRCPLVSSYFTVCATRPGGICRAGKVGQGPSVPPKASEADTHDTGPCGGQRAPSGVSPPLPLHSGAHQDRWGARFRGSCHYLGSVGVTDIVSYHTRLCAGSEDSNSGPHPVRQALYPRGPVFLAVGFNCKVSLVWDGSYFSTGTSSEWSV